MHRRSLFAALMGGLVAAAGSTAATAAPFVPADPSPELPVEKAWHRRWHRPRRLIVIRRRRRRW